MPRMMARFTAIRKLWRARAKPSLLDRQYGATHGLPIEIWENIFQLAHVAGHRLMAVSRTCRLFRQLVAHLVYRRAVLFYEGNSFGQFCLTLFTSDPLGGSRGKFVGRKLLGHLKAKNGAFLAWGLHPGNTYLRPTQMRTGQLHPSSIAHIQELEVRKSVDYLTFSLRTLPLAVLKTLATMTNLHRLHLERVPFNMTILSLFEQLTQLEELTLSSMYCPEEGIDPPPGAVRGLNKLHNLRLQSPFAVERQFAACIVASLAQPTLECFALENVRGFEDVYSETLAGVFKTLSSILKPDTLQQLFLWPVADINQPELVELLSFQSSLRHFAWYPVPSDEPKAVSTSYILPPGALQQARTIECHASHLPSVPVQNITQANISCEMMSLPDWLPLILELPSTLEHLCLCGLERFPVKQLSKIALNFPELKHLSLISEIPEINQEVYSTTAFQQISELWSIVSPLESLAYFPALSTLSIITQPRRVRQLFPPPMPHVSLWSSNFETNSIGWNYVGSNLERVQVSDVEWVRVGRGEWKVYKLEATDKKETKLSFPVHPEVDKLGLF